MRFIAFIACIASAASFTLQPAKQPTLRRSQPVTMLGGGGVPDVPFASSYKPGEISALWNSLKKCYGNEELARQAVAQNDQVLCPIYATPAMLSDSKKALVDIFGKDEALQIMSKSPMILTCGSELRSLKPDDIRSTANTRQFLDAFKGPAVLALPLGLIFILKALGGVVEAYS